MQPDYQIRPCAVDDLSSLERFLKGDIFAHQHLDWRSALQWAQQQPFWLLENKQGIQAILAAPVDPPGIAWVRLFACARSQRITEAWKLLFEPVKACLTSSDSPTIAALTMNDWFAELVLRQGFHHLQDIIILSWRASKTQPPQLPSGVVLRPMTQTDISMVEQLDQAAFYPLWQNSFPTLHGALIQPVYATILELKGQPVGYQITTTRHDSAHLVRLAVKPDFQRSGLGQVLVEDMLAHFYRQSILHITVNTQDDNYQSQALYQKLGFEKTGEYFSVFKYPSQLINHK
jgi:ribosomal protein S18 acetylase RimI-like enzyme